MSWRTTAIIIGYLGIGFTIGVGVYFESIKERVDESGSILNIINHYATPIQQYIPRIDFFLIGEFIVQLVSNTFWVVLSTRFNIAQIAGVILGLKCIDST